MKQPYECTDLADLHDQHTVVTKMCGGGQLRIFLVTHKLKNYFKNVPDDTLEVAGYNVAELKQTTWENLEANEPFNFIEGHPSYIGGLLDVIIAAEGNSTVQASLTTLKQECIDYCNSKSYAYTEWKQADLDNAKAKHTLEQNPTTVTVTTGTLAKDDGTDFLVNKYRAEHSISVTLDDAIAFDDVLTITAFHRKNNLESWVQADKAVGSIRVPANATQVELDGSFADYSTTTNHSELANVIRYFVTSKYNRAFTASLIKGA